MLGFTAITPLNELHKHVSAQGKPRFANCAASVAKLHNVLGFYEWH